jgi:hypothetical protein
MDDFERSRLAERNLRFEANRHMSTLNVAILVLVVALDQRFAEGLELAGGGLLLLGVSLLFSVLGMFSTVWNDWLASVLWLVPGAWCFILSTFTFCAGVLTLIVIPVL